MGLGLTRSLVVVDADTLQLQVRVSHIVATGVDSVLITDDLPELSGERRGQQVAMNPTRPYPSHGLEALHIKLGAWTQGLQ